MAGRQQVKVFAVFPALLFYGCAEKYPQGAVKDGTQAIAIAQKACDWKEIPGSFHARLETDPQGSYWFVWKGRDYRVQITINADTGRSADGCILPG